MARKPKIVLYQPQQVEQHFGLHTSFDMLPLEMLQVASIPVSQGYDVKIIDASHYTEDEGHRRALQACQDADIFGTTAILGYTVWDGHRCAEMVRAKFPNMKIIAGGWFPSCLPELYLQSGIYDAVCLGQGEITFWEFLQAVESGNKLDDVAGLALWRDGQMVKTAKREVVGWEKLPRAPWHLVDIAPYRDKQLSQDKFKTRLRMPSPPSVGRNQPYFGITYYSSFGCPEPCPFCCSPLVTNRRYKAIPADRMLDDLQDLKERWGFNVLRFHDANFGVIEKRTAEFAKGLIDRKLNLEWNSFIETNSINHYKPQTLDYMRDSGYYLAQIGAETGDETTLRTWVQKPFHEGDNVKAAREMHKRNINSSMTYIIGFPGEPEESMMKTLDEARRVVSENSTVWAHVFSYRPIPGTKLYDEALTKGYKPPATLRDWGNQLDYALGDNWKENVPPRVKRQLRLYYQYASFAQHVVRQKRGWIERLAEWRMRTGNYKFPLDLKAYYFVNNRLLRKNKSDAVEAWVLTSEKMRAQESKIDGAAANGASVAGAAAGSEAPAGKAAVPVG